MRILIVLAVVVSLGAAFAAEQELITITITLTNAQAETVSNAKGNDVKIEFTKEQTNAIAKEAGVNSVVNTITLNTMHLRPGNKVVVGYCLPHTPRPADEPLKVEPVRAP